MPRLARLFAVALLAACSVYADEPAGKPQEQAATTPANLRAQMLGVWRYHDRHRTFPAAYSVDKDGKPLLSWRVALLPLIGDEELFAEFRHDEPWDSDHNKKLLEKMPKVFRAPGSKAEVGFTTYLAVGGPSGIIANPRVRADQVLDGVANSIAIVEVNDKSAVEWTRPEQWHFKPADGLAVFAELPGDHFYAALCDGSVRRIPNATPPDMLRRMFDRTDGEVVIWPAEPR
jgi:hypothetical protein